MMESPEEENIIKDKKSFLDLKMNEITLQLKIFLEKKKILKQLKIECLEILRIFLSMKKQKSFITLLE